MARINTIRSAYSTEAPNGSDIERLSTAMFRLYWVDNSYLSETKGATFADYLKAQRELVKEYLFTMILDRMTITPEARGSFSYLRDGYFLDVPFSNARGVTMFSMSGLTRWSPINISGVDVDGDASFQDFNEMINFYLNPTDGTTTSDWELRFLDLKAPVSKEDPFGEMEWIIHPHKGGMREGRSSKRPFLRELSFEFMGLISNRNFPKSDDSFIQRTKGQSKPAEVLNEQIMSIEEGKSDPVTLMRT